MTTVLPGVVQVCEAQSGKAHDLDIPAACSVRELRDAMRRAADGDLADVPGAQATATPPHPGARFELLCIDEASDDAPVRLEDGRWLTHYKLPHEEKKVFAFRLDERTRVGAELHDLALHSSSLAMSSSTAPLGRSGLLRLSGSEDGDSARLDEAKVPAEVRELARAANEMADRETRLAARLALARRQVDTSVTAPDILADSPVLHPSPESPHHLVWNLAWPAVRMTVARRQL